jgi:hypothetical protein
MIEINEDQSIGKRVKKYVHSYYGDQFVIVFDDDTFVTLKARHDYLMDENDIDFHPLNYSDFGDDDLIKAGITKKGDK